jgi:hypothetical protein
MPNLGWGGLTTGCAGSANDVLIRRRQEGLKRQREVVREFLERDDGVLISRTKTLIFP